MAKVAKTTGNKITRIDTAGETVVSIDDTSVFIEGSTGVVVYFNKTDAENVVAAIQTLMDQ